MHLWKTVLGRRVWIRLYGSHSLGGRESDIRYVIYHSSRCLRNLPVTESCRATLDVVHTSGGCICKQEVPCSSSTLQQVPRQENVSERCTLPEAVTNYQRISCFPPVPLISMTLFNQISNRWLLKGLKDYFLAWARAHAILVVPPWQKVICWDMLTLMMVVGSINLELFKEILTSDPRAWTGSSHYLHVCSRGRLLFSIAG